MGTRSLTVSFDEMGKEIVVMYRQFDGYPEGHGKELADFLKGIKIVNGIDGTEPLKFANGMNCLAAQVVAEFKNKPGEIYLYANGTRNCGEDYVYYVSGKVGDVEPTIRINCGDGEIYDGLAGGFDNFIKTLQEKRDKKELEND